ncbi:MAG: cytochrome c [Candidatus Eisenbacteria bacterium]|nr:cytochrome c [Candidatus Eisenbacteria bacterium]
MPRWIRPFTVVLVVLSWIPLALIARERMAPQQNTRLQVIPDMDQQPRYRPLMVNPAFADRRADRRGVEGTVPRGGAQTDTHLYEGQVNGAWATRLPMAVTAETMRRGQERFEIFCAPCHGYSGRGDGIVARRADALQEGTWTPPSSLHDPTVVARPVGQIFHTITHGIRNMPPYGPQIPVEDRWAIVAYVRALQRSQNATIEDVPPELRPQLR